MQKYKVCAYLRISKRENEKHSIVNQRKIINDYIKEHSDLEIYSYYEDNGYSRTNDNMTDIEVALTNIGEIATI